MAELMRVNLRRKSRLLAHPTHHEGEPDSRKRPTAFREENEVAMRRAFALEPPERTKLIALQCMRGRRTVFYPANKEPRLI